MQIPARLLLTRRFAPFFAVLLTGAYNDNVLRNALVVLVTYQVARYAGLDSGALVAAAAGIFILPFFLFSATGGALADRYPRHRLVRAVKLAEMLLMALAWLGFAWNSLGLLFAVLFLTGLQSALFGPVKYAILPNLLGREELLGGNAWVAAGTFAAILAGTLTGTLLMAAPDTGAWVPGVLLASAGFGYACSRFVPAQAPGRPGLALSWNPLRETARILRQGLAEPGLPGVMLAISWFWMIGAGVLVQLPVYMRDTLAGNEQALGGVLAVFTIGVALGALLCGALARGRDAGRHGPAAAALIGAACLLLALEPALPGPARGFGALLADPQARQSLGLLLLLAVAGGYYIVPLYTRLQRSAEDRRRARAIACTNILNALAMVLVSVLAMLLHGRAGAVAELWGVLAGSAFLAAALQYRADGGRLLALALAPLLRVTVAVEAPVARGALVLVRRGSARAAWALAACVPGRVEICAPAALARSPALLLLARWTPVRGYDPDDPARAWPPRPPDSRRATVLLPPPGPAGEAKLLEVLREAERAPERPLALAHVTGAEPSPQRFRARLAVVLEGIPPEQRPADVYALLDRLGALEYRVRCRERTVLESLHAAAGRYGGRRAILDDGERTLSYRGLLTGVYAVAGLLRRALPAEREPVGVLLPNVTATPVTFFALHALGRTPVMLNYSAGEASMLSACRTARLRHVVTSRRFIAKAGLEPLAAALEEVCTVLWLEDLRAQLSAGLKLGALLRAHRRPPPGDPEEAAVVLFTSGSEGEPKGVVLSHRNLQRNHAQVQAVLDFWPGDRVLLCLPLFHSFALGVGLLLPLSLGLRCSMYPNPLHYKEIPERIAALGITVFFSSDTFLNGYARTASRAQFASLRLTVAGAEKLKSATRELWRERFGVEVQQGYGVTETSPAVSVNTPACARPGSVGRLMPAIEARLEPLPGEPAAGRGRLLLRGPNVMTGYWRPDNPRVLAPPPDGWHDTGDVAEFDADGFLTLHGRAKRFAKIGGEMVSLAQVEQQVAEVWPEHRHVVCAVAHESRGEQLVLLTEHPEPDAAALRAALRQRGVADLARPRHVRAVAELPLLGTGKPDLRRAQELAETVL